MASLNKVMIIGNLGGDPEVRAVGESKVANFSVAVTERYKDKDGNQKETTEWFSVVFWNRQAEICEQYLKKGSPVYIEGKLTTRTWDDAKTGEKKYRTEVRGMQLQMLGGGNGSEKQASATPTNAADPNMPPEDDLPF